MVVVYICVRVCGVYMYVCIYVYICVYIYIYIILLKHNKELNFSICGNMDGFGDYYTK